MANSYKNAFKCHKCPQNNTEKGCPAWQEVILTNPATGEQKVIKDCYFQVMPIMMVESIKASVASTNTAAGMKNEVAKGLAGLANAMLSAKIPQLIAEASKD